MVQEWQLQEAKNKLSHVVKQACEGQPQFITVHGKQAAVLISTEEYKRLTHPKTKLSEVLLAPELAGDDLDFERDKDTGRELGL